MVVRGDRATSSMSIVGTFKVRKSGVRMDSKVIRRALSSSIRGWQIDVARQWRVFQRSLNAFLFLVLLTSAGIPPSVNASENDRGRVIRVALLKQRTSYAGDEKIGFTFSNGTNGDVHFSCAVEGHYRGEWRELATDARGSIDSMKEEILTATARGEMRTFFIPSKVLGEDLIRAMRGRPYRLACRYYLSFEEIGVNPRLVKGSEFRVDP